MTTKSKPTDDAKKYEYFVGIDLHKKFMQVAIMDADGTLLQNTRIECDYKIIASEFSKFPKNAKYVIESSSVWYGMYRFLRDKLKLDVILSNPRTTKVIASSKKKTAKVDAKILDGSVHNMTLLRELLPQLGEFGKMLQGAIQADVAPTLPKPDDITPQVTPETPRKKDRKKVTKKPRHVIPNAVTRAMHALFCLDDVQQSIECAMRVLCDHTDEQRETTDAMTRLQSTTKDVMKIYADAGFQGSDKDMKGADVHHILKKLKNKELIPEKKAYNCELSKIRIIIENSIGASKHFSRIATIYNADLDQLNDEINIVCGLANLRNMHRNGTYDYWALILGLCIKL